MRSQQQLQKPKTRNNKCLPKNRPTVYYSYYGILCNKENEDIRATQNSMKNFKIIMLDKKFVHKRLYK